MSPITGATRSGMLQVAQAMAALGERASRCLHLDTLWEFGTILSFSPRRDVVPYHAVGA
jgi:hypothetical protein